MRQHNNTNEKRQDHADDARPYQPDFQFYLLGNNAMRERNVLNDNEWTGWLLWMRNCFKYGTIREDWKQIQSERWLSPFFENFVTREILAA